ncbi:MAG: DUF3794 domain-containing protein [Oscillospiraceae bacterium]|nr:DUF3794 domain-containing protein [Oscillospiraceae bacterium]
MELTRSHESICINEVIYDSVLEQPVELDYILPDYNPGIFKILKCRLIPKIVSKRISGDQFVLDGMIFIKILYVAEADSEAEKTNVIRAIEQKVPFSKTAELKKAPEKFHIRTDLRTDYINCRVVNPRRLDIRGTVSCKTVVTEMKCEQLLTDVKGMGAQVRKQKFPTDLDKKSADKQFTLHEEFNVPPGMPAENIINISSDAISSEHRIIANKVVVKGSVMLRILYSTANEDNKLCVIEQEIQVSQIVDIPEIDESYDCSVSFDVISADAELVQDVNGAASIISCTVLLAVNCSAFKSSEIEAVADIYSTNYESSLKIKNIHTQKMIKVVREDFDVKETLDLGGQIFELYDVLYGVKNVAASHSDDGLIVKCELDVSALGCDNDHIPCCIDRVLPLELKLPDGRIDDIAENDSVTAGCRAAIVSMSHTLAGTDKVELRVQMKIYGEIFGAGKMDAVIEAEIDEQKPKLKDSSAALTVYFADAGESVWDIAKRYNAAVFAIIEENALAGLEENASGQESGILNEREMLLIPGV